MSLTLEDRAAGDNSRIPLEWTDGGDPPVPVDLGTFTSIELEWERPNETLVSLPIVIDDGPNGLGHFEPTTAIVTAGQIKLRVKAIVTATGEEQYYPGKPVCLQVYPALQSNP